MDKALTFGLIGCGAYGKVHARVYHNHPGVHLKALWSPTRENREASAQRFACWTADTWQEIVEDPAIDCVAIATPDFAHTEYAVASLRAGKHVILEKPMAMNTADCKKILEERDRSGKKLMINYHNRWYPAFVEARKTILEGRIGRPVSATFVLSDTLSWVEENMRWAHQSGPEWFLMTHTVDLACWLLDDRPVEIFAMAHEGLLESKGLFTRDLVQATMRFIGGAIVHLESSWVLARNWRNSINDMWLSIQGEDGRIDVNADFENICITSNRYETPLVLLEHTEDRPIQDFIGCVLEDRPVPVTGEEGLLATRVVEAVVKSYRERRMVRLDESESAS
jgi:predicted dehydrogenase